MVKQSTIPFSEDQLKKLRSLRLPEVKENNKYLVLHVKGDGIRAPPTWNTKIYRKSSGVLTLYTTDTTILQSILSNQPIQVKDKGKFTRTVMVDDSGWGFPLKGVLIGLWDSKTNIFMTEEVPVRFFQSPLFESKNYLVVAAESTMRLLKKLNIKPEKTTVIQLCCGYVNNETENVLKKYGYDVERCEIKEPLQSKLEMAHSDYINKEYDSIYYDPKELNSSEIGRQYYKVIDWIKANRAWKDAKTGWRSLKYIKRMEL